MNLNHLEGEMKRDRLYFFRQQFWPVAVCSMLIHHRDGIVWGIVNLLMVVVIVLVASLLLSVVRKPSP